MKTPGDCNGENRLSMWENVYFDAKLVKNDLM